MKIFSHLNKGIKNKAEDFHFKRKEKMVIKDYETAFNGINRCNTKILQLRQWCILIIVALVTISFTESNPPKEIMYISLLSYLLFFILEIRVISAKRFNHNQVLFLEKIFMLRDEKEYKSRIMAYEFRSTYYDKNIDFFDKLRYLFYSITIDFILWNVFLIIFWLLAFF